MTTVSVIIPAFNAATFIRRTIDSVLAQSYRDFEVIVVDDGSGDDTGAVVRSYGASVRYIRQANAGDGAARNTGVAAARGSWLAFLDHDDEWLPAKLERQMQLLAEHPHLRWCCTNRYETDGKRRTVVAAPKVVDQALAGRGYFEDFFPADVQGVCPIITSTLIVHREVFERVGVFGTHWRRWADRDLWWRIAYEYPRIGYLAQPLAILHLNLQHARSQRLNLESKRGDEGRALIAEHLDLARRHGRLEAFTPVAVQTLRTCLLTAIYHGCKADAREIVRQFPNLLPRRWRWAAYALTVFPRATLVLAQGLAYLLFKLRLQRKVSRRWVFGRNLVRPS